MVIKIYAPEESGINYNMDYSTELYGLSFAHSLGVPVPEVMAAGVVRDKYFFQYLILRYIDGLDFNEYSRHLNTREKIKLAKSIRDISDRWNIGCENFNGIDVLYDLNRQTRWEKYPEGFKQERVEYIKTHDFGKRVFVHGDLCYDNLIISPTGTIHIIDFADAVIAPLAYEQGHLAAELFNFDTDFLKGYFGEYNTDYLVDLCFKGLLIHDFGGDITAKKLGPVDTLYSLWDLRKRILGILM
ncbi:MAG: aminoglycoside phosphotransferase family protein [Treponema sp.]|nr:aminoglycoside phosphotransferase family protein [Treponema sp.]